jgi:hypothetical protein
MEILLKQSNDNILLVSEQKGHIEKLLKSLIINVSSSYNENDIQLLTSNSLALSENTYFPALECNILSNKLHYVYGLLKHIEQIIVQREESFKKQSVDNYQKYREKSGLSVPRLLYVLDNLHEILDSDTTISDEIILLLNDLLIMSGKYGIHFIVAGAPTDNLLKLNLSEDFNFKAFVSIQPENIELVSNLISEENMDYAAQPEQGIIFKESSSTVNQFTVNKLTDDELSKKLRNIESPDTNRILSRPTSFVDYNDDYPLLYQQIKLKHINPVEDKYVIGIPRFYKDNYYSLPYANGESASKILVLGDDNAALKSLMQSINFAKKGNVEIMAYDAAGNINSTSDIKVIHSDLEEYLQSFVDKIDGNNDVVKGIVCLFNMDEFDMQNQDAKLKLKDFIHQTAKMGIYLLFHAKSDNIFASDNLGEITKTCFEHKIALMDLMDSPNSLIAPIHYVKNAGFITTPQKPLEIVYEGINSVSGFGIDNIWLLKND